MKYGLRPKGITKPPMNNYRLSRLAADDLEEIAEYTIERFGIEHARRYRDGLKTCFVQLANNPAFKHGRAKTLLDEWRAREDSKSVFHVVRCSNLRQ